jgi:hypothetical protein
MFFGEQKENQCRKNVAVYSPMLASGTSENFLSELIDV